MMKKTILVLLCLAALLMLAGCATVNSDNSFQNAAPGEVSSQPQVVVNQPVDAPVQDTPEVAPTSDPNAAGFNG